MKNEIFKSSVQGLAVLAAGLLAACGGGAVAPALAPGVATYAVAGTVSGMKGVAVISNGSEDVTLSANGSFNFQRKVNDGDSFSVRVATAPVGQNCTLSGGSGGASESSAVRIICSDNAGSNVLRVVPVIGRFMPGAAVRVTTAGRAIYTGLVDVAGAASIVLPASAAGPFLIEAGKTDDSYFSLLANAVRHFVSSDPYRGDVAIYALRAMAAALPASQVIAVTPLTEIAIGRLELMSGPAAATAAAVQEANAVTGAAFGIDDILLPPTLVSAQDAKISGNTGADRYALLLAGLAKMSQDEDFWMIYSMREDFRDGHLDGRIYAIVNTLIRSEILTVDAKKGATPAQFTTALNGQIAQASLLFGVPGLKPPVVADITLEGRRFFVNGVGLIIDPLPVSTVDTPVIHTITVGFTYLADNRSALGRSYRGATCMSETPGGLPLLITTCTIAGQDYNYHIIENQGARNAKICWRRRDGSAVNVCEAGVISLNGGVGSRVEIIASKAPGLDINF